MNLNISRVQSLCALLASYGVGVCLHSHYKVCDDAAEHTVPS